jgi:hypothetical protein
MSQSASANDLAAELRAEIARRQVAIYRLAPTVGLHPSHLGQVLAGRRPLSPELAARIRQAVSETGGPERNPLMHLPPNAREPETEAADAPPESSPLWSLLLALAEIAARIERRHREEHEPAEEHAA